VIPDIVGVTLSAYNEISVAIINSNGLLSLSSQKNIQNDPVYTGSYDVPVNAPSVN